MPRLPQNKLVPSHVGGAGLPQALSPDTQPAMSFSPRGRRTATGSGANRAARGDGRATDLALYRSIFQQAFDGILVADGSGRVIEANPRACEMLGYAPGEMGGLEVRALLAPEEVGGPEGLLSGLRSGDAVRAECGLVCKSGDSIVADVSVKLMDDGRTQVIMRDVTERKRAERALRESVANYRSLVETSPDAVIVTDLAGRVVLTNRQAVELFGYDSIEELAGRGMLDSVAPEDVAQSPANLIGSVDAIVDQLQTWRATCDLSYIVVPSRLMLDAAPIVARLVGT